MIRTILNAIPLSPRLAAKLSSASALGLAVENQTLKTICMIVGPACGLYALGKVNAQDAVKSELSAMREQVGKLVTKDECHARHATVRYHDAGPLPPMPLEDESEHQK